MFTNIYAFFVQYLSFTLTMYNLKKFQFVKQLHFSPLSEYNCNKGNVNTLFGYIP